jgi:hypothetical protein
LVFKVSPLSVNLTPQRAIQHNAVLEDAKRSHDPRKFTVLTDNDFDQYHPDGSADNVGSNPVDIGDDSVISFDFSHSDLGAGTLSLVLSDPSAVRLFKDGKTPLSAADMTMDLSNPVGAFLNETHFWLQALKPSPDFTISLVYRDGFGHEVRDDVHMNLVEYKPLATGSSTLSFPATTTLGTLTAATDLTSGVTVPDASLISAQFNGIAPGATVNLRVSSTDNPADTFTEPVAADGSTADRFAVYSSARLGNVLSAAERASVASKLGIKAIVGLGGQIIFSTLFDQLPAEQPAVQLDVKQVDPSFEILMQRFGQPSPGRIHRPIYDEGKDIQISLAGVKAADKVQWKIGANDDADTSHSQTIRLSSDTLVADDEFSIPKDAHGDVVIQATVNGKDVYKQKIHVALSAQKVANDLFAADMNDAWLATNEPVSNTSGASWGARANFSDRQWTRIQSVFYSNLGAKSDAEKKAADVKLTDLLSQRIIFAGPNAAKDNPAFTHSSLDGTNRQAGTLPYKSLGVIVTQNAFAWDKADLDFLIGHEREQLQRIGDLANGRSPLTALLAGYADKMPNVLPTVEKRWDELQVISEDLARIAQGGAGNTPSWNLMSGQLFHLADYYNYIVEGNQTQPGSLMEIKKDQDAQSLPAGSYAAAFNFVTQIRDSITKSWGKTLTDPNPNQLYQLLPPITEAKMAARLAKIKNG